MWQKAGFTLIILGILAIVSWITKDFFAATDIPLLLRIAVGAIGAGILILIGVVIRDRVSKSKTENFKGVER